VSAPETHKLDSPDATARAVPAQADRAGPQDLPAHGGPRNGRVAFAALWIAGQAALIGTSGNRPDHIFGFRMFPEASTMEIHLWRDTAAGPQRAPGGEWSARDQGGQLRHFSWHDRVRDPILGSIDARVFASYGVETQLARMGRAVADVTDHLTDDAETQRLIAEVVVRRNGRGPETVAIEGPWRIRR
jgi:hypothetical protein